MSRPARLAAAGALALVLIALLLEIADQLAQVQP